jgi:hypothetical protein
MSGYGLVVTCEGPRQHQQTLYLPDHARTDAEALGGILDGTSPLFLLSPRDDPASKLARCCGALIRAEVFGYAEPGAAP